MIGRLSAIAYSTYREAVRDRVLYNLIVFAMLIVGSSLLVGQISLQINRIVLINLGLTAISLFGVVIAIFIGIGLVSKEIEKRTIYTVLAARPVRRWEFITGKFLGLVMTLTVNALLMSFGFFAAVLYVSHGLGRGDLQLITAIYFILLEFVLITALALLFSTFSTPLFSSIFAFAMFAVGTFAEDLRGFAQMATGLTRWVMIGASYLIPNFAALNVISRVAHDATVEPKLILLNTLYVLTYTAAVLTVSVWIFERRNLK
jgi:ABC-type transport system involved in multi-copper enzyme maturation permease subunit